MPQFGVLAHLDVMPTAISVAGRMLATFPEKLKPHQHVPNNIAHLGELYKTSAAVIVKLSNVSASIPQLKRCIAELFSERYDVLLYPQDPGDNEKVLVWNRYASVHKSAVTPVLARGGMSSLLGRRRKSIVSSSRQQSSCKWESLMHLTNSAL